MVQHRILTILLFVCFPQCFEVAPSQLKANGARCTYSDECESRCCSRDSPKYSGKCVQKSTPDVKCYGPNNGDPCFRSQQCNSKCCFPRDSMYNAVCVAKYDQKCIGPNNGDFCCASDQCTSGCCLSLYDIRFPAVCADGTADCLGLKNGDYCALNAECDSGCCKEIPHSQNNRGRCAPKGAENDFCDLVTSPGLYSSCPCESGLVCEMYKSLNKTHPIVEFFKKLDLDVEENEIELFTKNTKTIVCTKPYSK